jgi:dolichol-phosphate mannosyltransferase
MGLETQATSRVETAMSDKRENQRTLVTVATYNEIENLPLLVDEILQYAPDVDILVIDDNSPDGTGQWCDQRAAEDDRVHCLHREGKLGLGTATIAGMRYAIEHQYDLMLNLDADFSHHPRYVPNLLAGMREDSSAGQPMAAGETEENTAQHSDSAENGSVSRDVMIGSRYVPGGGCEGWPLHRRLMSRGVNLYARVLLGLPPRDCSGAFRCFRTEALKKLDFDEVQSKGYSFQEEILWRLKRIGARFGETPIIFADREKGQSKIDSREALAALWIIFRLGVRNWIGI